MQPETHESSLNDANAVFTKLFLTPEGRANPYPPYHQLRQTAPVHRIRLGMWLLSRYDDCWAAMRDPRLGKEYASPGDSSRAGSRARDARSAAARRSCVAPVRSPH